MRRAAQGEARVVTRTTALVIGVALVAIVAVGEVQSSRYVEAARADSAALAAARPASAVPPHVRGEPVVGETLKTTRGRWRGDAPFSFVVRWSRCGPTLRGCARIRGATGLSYLVTRADLGRSLRSSVTAINSNGSRTSVSRPTAVAVRPGTRIRGIAISRLGAQWRTGSGYERYAYVIVGRHRARDAAAQPGTSLVYHSGTSVNTQWDAGVPYAVARDRGWLLTDAAGTLLVSLQYPTNFIGDVGSDAYRAEFARRVGDHAVSTGVDGVYIDDVVADISTMSGRFPAKYPNREAWEDAMAGFVQTVGTRLEARGLYVLVNAHKWVEGNPDSNNGILEAQWWSRIGRSVSGLQSEYWLQDATNVSRVRSTGSAWWQNWDGWQRLVSVAQGMGADFVGYTYGSATDVRAMRFGKASFMLDWDGAGGAFIYQPTEDGDPWNPAWTTDLGRPSGPKAALAPGVWTRRFERGSVVVNATTTATTVTLDGIARAVPATDALILPR